MKKQKIVPPEDRLTVPEFAKALGISERTVYNYIDKKHIKVFRTSLGRNRVYIPKSEIKKVKELLGAA